MRGVLLACGLMVVATPCLAQSQVSATGVFGSAVTVNQGAAAGQIGVGVVLGTQTGTTVVSVSKAGALFSSSASSSATALGVAFGGGSYNVGVQSGKPVTGTFAVNLPVSIGFTTP